MPPSAKQIFERLLKESEGAATGTERFELRRQAFQAGSLAINEGELTIQQFHRRAGIKPDNRRWVHGLTRSGERI